MAQKANKPTLYGGIFLLTCGALIFELSLLRLFMVAKWYHFAFLIVSIAMLGLGAAGSFLTVFSTWRERLTSARLSNLAFLFAIAFIVSYTISNQIPFDQQKISWDIWQFFYLLLYYCILAVPFFFVGLPLSSIYASYSGNIGKLYFFDLFGAAVGSAVALIASSFAGGLGGIWLAAICGAIGGFLFAPRLIRGLTAFIIICLVGLIWLFEPPFLALKMSEYKALPQLLRPPDAKVIHTEWTPTARIDLVQSPLVHFAPGLSLLNDAALPPQLGIVVDGSNLNAVTKFDGNPRALTFVENLPSALPFYLSKIESMLVCEPLGGLDFLTGLHYGVRKIEGAGIYNRAAEIISQKLDSFSGGLFRDRRIKMAAMSPRAYLRQNSAKHDLICLPISDSFGAAGTGIYGLSEYYLYTVESFSEFLSQLAENGWLYVACYLLPPLRQELRLVSLGVSALEAKGVQSPQANLIAIRTLSTFSLLIKNTPITQTEIDSLKSFCQARSFDLVYYNGIDESELNKFNRFVEPIVYQGMREILQQASREKFYQNYLFGVRPTTDARPFFGHFFRWDRLKEEYDSLGRKWTAFLEGGYLTAVAFLQACIVGMAFIVLPLFARNRNDSQPRLGKGKLAILAYFFSIGMAYILVEIVLIQRFILFLDHPIYATSAVIGSLLISSACGSFVSSRIGTMSSWTIRTHLLVLCLVLVFYMFFLSNILSIGIGQNLGVRYVIAIFLNAIPGFLMGFPFPSAIRKIGDFAKGLIPWAYCANSVASVIASSLAVLIALEFGFRSVIAITIGFYLTAALAELRWHARSVST